MRQSRDGGRLARGRRWVSQKVRCGRVARVLWPLLLLACACERQLPTFRLADGRLPNVLLITVDTLRADHLGCYQTQGSRGGSASPAVSAMKVTPNLDRLASESIVFEHASTPVPATLPALASLHSGRYPGGHPVRTNRMRLPADVPLLAERLRAAGYSTAAYYGNILLEPKSGFDRGFEGYTSFVPLAGPADPQGADLASGWIALAPSEPWFLWVHFMDPHGPYNSAPPSWSEGLGEEDRLPDITLPFSDTNYGLGVIPDYQRLDGIDRAREYRRRYGGEVHFTDAQLGRLLAALDEPKLRQSTLVLLTADHGESLGEHDYYFQHGWFPYQESIQVPLILRLPAAAAVRRVAEPVSLIDVVPTLLGGLKLDPPRGLAGRDLRAAIGGAVLPPAPVFAVTAYLNQMTAVRRGEWKLVHTPGAPEAIAGDPWAGYYARQESFALYDLSADPGEKRDLAVADPARAEALRSELLQWEKARGIPFGRRPEAELDPATRERMKALGYAS